jgi:hypothetical protein
VANELRLDWKTVKELDQQYMGEQLRRAGRPAPQVIGIDELSIRKGHTYRIVVSDLLRRRPIWFGGQDRSEASLDEFYQWLGPKQCAQIRLAVMDMWKPFGSATARHAPEAAILFDKFHIMRHLGEALDRVRQQEYARLTGSKRRFIKGQKYALLTHRENLDREGRRALQELLRLNRRLHVAYLLKESFGQLWDYQREGWARRFFENWKASLKWQRLKPYEKFARLIDAHWDGHRGVLSSGEQGLAGLRRRSQQQNPGHSAASLWPARPGVSAFEGADLHAAAILTARSGACRMGSSDLADVTGAPIRAGGASPLRGGDRRRRELGREARRRRSPARSDRRRGYPCRPQWLADLVYARTLGATMSATHAFRAAMAFNHRQTLSRRFSNHLLERT